MMEPGRWQEVGRYAEQAMENVGRLQWLTNSAVGRSAYAYLNIVAAVCKWLSRGDSDFSRSIWIASFTLTSLTIVMACIISFTAAALVHDLIDDTALLAFGVAETLACLIPLLYTVLDALSNVIYWVIIGLGVAIHLMMTLGSLIIGAGAVVFGVLGVYMALKYDLNNLQSLIQQ